MLSPADIKNHSCLTSPQIPWLFKIDNEEIKMKVASRWSSNSGDALLQAAMNGLGITRLADIYLEGVIKKGEIEIVLPDFEMPQSTTYLVYSDKEFLPYRIRILIDFLVERFK